MLHMYSVRGRQELIILFQSLVFGFFEGKREIWLQLVCMTARVSELWLQQRDHAH